MRCRPGTRVAGGRHDNLGRCPTAQPCLTLLESRARPSDRRTLAAAYETLPDEAFTGAAAAPHGPAGHGTRRAAALHAHGPWAPPGLRQPWPEDEYLRDGGDEGLPTGVGRQRRSARAWRWKTPWPTTIRSTAAPLVEPSNEVYLYSPRFGAVRQVVGLVANEERQQRRRRPHARASSTRPTTLQLVANAKQNIQPGDEIGARPPVALRTQAGQGRDVDRHRAARLPRHLQGLREPGDHPPGHVRGGRDAAPRPRRRRPPSPGRTPRPCRSSSTARAPWPK